MAPGPGRGPSRESKPRASLRTPKGDTVSQNPKSNLKQFDWFLKLKFEILIGPKFRLVGSYEQVVGGRVSLWLVSVET